MTFDHTKPFRQRNGRPGTPNAMAVAGALAHDLGHPRDYTTWAEPRDESLAWIPCPRRESDWIAGWDEAREHALGFSDACADINAMHRSNR